jgi:hypothetical protein
MIDTLRRRPASALQASSERPRLRCRLGRHRMRYSGVLLGRRVETCERCRRRVFSEHTT